jgi:hypothetical protein
LQYYYYAHFTDSSGAVTNTAATDSNSRFERGPWRTMTVEYDAGTSNLNVNVGSIGVATLNLAGETFSIDQVEIRMTEGAGASVEYSRYDNLTVIPEPATGGLLLLGAAGLLKVRQLKRRIQ